MPRGRPKGSKNKSQETTVKLVLVSDPTHSDNNAQSSEPKRGRGRPRKNTQHNIAKLLENNDQPKRGRGRPRKNLEKVLDFKLEMTDVGMDVVNPSTEKRGRGRPRKHPVKDVSMSSTNETDQPKRGRGRPRKHPETPKKDAEIIFMAASKQAAEEKPFVYVLDKSIVDKTEHENMIEKEVERQKIVSFKVGSNADNVYKPSVMHLANAYSVEYTEKGRIFSFNSNIGDKIVIEYPQNWRRTEEWIVDDINYENGDLRLKHSIEGYYASCNYIIGPTVHGVKIKKVN